MVTLIFDLDGTLYCNEKSNVCYSAAVYDFIASRKNISKEQAKEIFQSTKKSLGKEGSSTNTFLALGFTRDDFFSVCNRVDPREYAPREPALRAWLESLKQKGFRLFILGNSPRQLVRNTLSAMGIMDLFEKIYSAQDFTKSKPDSLPFEGIIGNHPEETVFYSIGDRVDVDLAPAKKVGMKTVLIKQTSMYAGNQIPDPAYVDHTIYKLEELDAILGKHIK